MCISSWIALLWGYAILWPVDSTNSSISDLFLLAPKPNWTGAFAGPETTNSAYNSLSFSSGSQDLTPSLIIHTPACLKREGVCICIICICNIHAHVQYMHIHTQVFGISICTHRCIFQHLSPLVPVARFYLEETAPQHIHGQNSQSPAMVPSAAWGSHKLFAARNCSIYL